LPENYKKGEAQRTEGQNEILFELRTKGMKNAGTRMSKGLLISNSYFLLASSKRKRKGRTE